MQSKFDGFITELADTFGAVADAMLTVVLSFVGGRAAFDEASGAIDEASGALNEEAVEWVEEILPEVYAQGAREALSSPVTPDISPQSLSQDVHEETLALFQDELVSELSAATTRMTDDAKANLREIARRRLAASLDNGTNARDEARRMRDEMNEKGVKFVDRSGRRWDPRAYSELVLRTHTVAVSNEGNLNTAAELGSPGVRVFDGKADSDQPCIDADGQVWTLQYARANKLQHPGCRRAFAPLPGSFSGTFDRGGPGGVPPGGGGGSGGPGGDEPLGPDDPGGPNGEWFAREGKIDPAKFTNYLFLPDHKDNVGKAKGWLGLGLGNNPGDAELAERLIKEQLPGAGITERPTKGSVRLWEALIPNFKGANGRVVELVTGWALDPGRDLPHLTTAHVRSRKKGIQ